MSIQLLDKTRKINKMLHNNTESRVVFSEMCSVLGEVIHSTVIVLSKKGKVLGLFEHPDVSSLTELLCYELGGLIDTALNERLLNVLSTKENVNLELLGFPSELSVNYHGMITPVEIAGQRLGTLFAFKTGDAYVLDDIILGEYGATIIGLDMLRAVKEELAEEERKEQMVRAAISTLSYSELEAMVHIFDELGGQEGILVASKIADRVGITRSVIVNALRKFESAGIIASRSSGMRGTYIRVLNDYMLPALDEARREHHMKL